MISWGEIPLGTVIPFPFATYAGSTGASITLTGLAVTDIEVYKGTSVTQRASDVGYTLIDTDGIDIDTITGIHGFSIDTGDNTDAGFFVAGSLYWVIVSAVTIDAQTVNFVAGTFRLVATESVAGVKEVDLTHVAGATTNVAALATNVDTILADTNDMQARLPAALVGGRIDASVGAIAAAVITAASIAADAITDAKVAADVTIASVTGAVGSVTANVNAVLTNGAHGGAAATAQFGGAGGITATLTGNVTGSVGSVTGAVGSVTGAVGSVTGLTASNLDATISSRATPAQVKTQVVDALNVDTYAEPAQGAPAATTTLANKISFIYKAWRNKVTQTATTYSLMNDDALTVDHKSTVSDDGTTFTRGEVASGP